VGGAILRDSGKVRTMIVRGMHGINHPETLRYQRRLSRRAAEA
jgi:hypothetical protein